MVDLLSPMLYIKIKFQNFLGSEYLEKICDFLLLFLPYMGLAAIQMYRVAILTLP